MITIEELEKQLNQNEINGIYLFFGQEAFLLDSAVKKIKKSFIELINGINYVTIDENNIKGLISDMETPAFGFPKKLIIVKNSGVLKKEGRRKDPALAEVKEQLNQYLNENYELVQESVVLVFIEEEIEKLKLFKTIDKIGTVCNFELQKPIQITKRLKKICQAYKVKVEDTTLIYLIEECGQNMQNLINEIRKLIEYAGEGGIIQKQDIDQLCAKQMQAVIFDLTDNLGKKNIAGALVTLNALLYQKEPIQKILITLYHHFKKLYLVQLAMKYNQDIAQTLKLSPNQMFLVNKYKTQARFFTEKELKEILNGLREIDYKSKIGMMDLNLGLETVLCQYCSKNRSF